MNRIYKVGLAAVLALTVLIGCGSDSSTPVAETSGEDSRLFPWLKGPTREFLVPYGGDNVVQTFGREGTAEERAEVTALISAWLRARAAKDWKKDCSYFSRNYSKLLTQDANSVTDGRVKTCPEALAFFKGNASGNYLNTLDGSIDSLRVGEGQGIAGTQAMVAFAQYHGNDGKDWVVPLEKEDGKWKVTKAAPINRLR